MMYNLEYLPLAKEDILEIVRYISQDLNNPTAATELSKKLIESGNNLQHFPYSNPVYIPPRPLKNEYRKLFVQNYIMLYFVNEKTKTITIARVIYSRRNYSKLL